MTDQEPRSPTNEATERAYLRQRVREMEAENAALASRVDHLLRRIDQLNSLMANMSRAGQMLRVARTSIRRPGSLVRLPADLVRVARSPVAVPEVQAAPGTDGGANEATVARGHRVMAAGRAHERWLLANGPRDPSSLRVAVVADDPLVRGLAPECELIPIEPNTWKPVLEANRPDLLLVQSAWRGPAGAWQYRIAWHPYPDAYRLEHLRALVDWCRTAGIPTVFWSTEDPLQLDRFAQAAELFDHVFTVDPGSVARLADLPGRSAARVAHLPMAVQPRIFNPTGRSADPSPVAFIGARYHGLSLGESDDLELLLDAGARAGLTIFDRKLGADERLFGFPDRHRERISGWLPTTAIPDAIRAHRVILGAPDRDAIPGRVFEALACGRPVVTTSRSAAARTFEHGVFGGASAEDLDRILADIADRTPTLDPAVDAAVADIMRSHTYRHRLVTIAREVGFDMAAVSPAVAMIALVDDDAAVNRLAEAAVGLGGEVQELVVGTTDDSRVGPTCRERLAAVAGHIPARVVHQAAEQPATRYRRLAAVADSPWVHVHDVTRPGTVRSLERLLGAIAYAGADVIGAPVANGPAYAPATAVDPLRAIIRRATLLERGWLPDQATAAAEMGRWSLEQVRIYAVAAATDEGPG